MADVTLTAQLDIKAPSRSQLSAAKRKIQSSLSDVNANIQLNGASATQKSLSNINNRTKELTKSTVLMGNAVGDAARRFASYTSAAVIVGRLASSLSRATSDAIKFEREFVKLSQIFDRSVPRLASLNKEISALSKEFGLSANLITKTSVVLAQSGLSARDTEKALRSLAKTTLASTFNNISQTAEGAVAILAQFEEGVGSLESQLGAINAVSKKFAVESSDIIEAVRRSGGAFRAAGGDLNDFIALFTAVRSTTRESAETISTGFRTIFARLQRPKVIDYFRELNIELTDGAGNFVGAFEAVRRLSEGLDAAGISAGSIKFAEVVEQLGGIRQVSRVIPLLGEFTKAERARQVAVAGGTSLDADAAKAQETLAQSFARTQENFNALIREISQTESFQIIVRSLLGVANAFIEVARAIKPLIPLIATFGALQVGSIAKSALGSAFKKPIGLNRGGVVPGTGNSDTVPAMLTPGEFVIRKSAVQAFGAKNLAGINKYASGGTVKKKFGDLESTKIIDEISKIKNKSGKRVVSPIDSVKLRVDDEVISARRVQNLADRGDRSAELLIQNQGTGTGVRRGKLWEEVASKILRKSLPSGNPNRPLDSINTDYKYKKRTDAIIPVEIAKKRVQDTLGINGGFRSDKRLFSKYTTKIGESRIADPVKIVRPGWRVDDPGSFQRNAQRRNRGGSINGVGTDTVPALLTPGEFVVNKKSAESFGYDNLKNINKYAKGGVVSHVQKFNNGGTVAGKGGVGVNLLAVSAGLTTLTGIMGELDKTAQALVDGIYLAIASTIGLKAAFEKVDSLKAGKKAGKKADGNREVVKEIQESSDISKEGNDYLKQIVDKLSVIEQRFSKQKQDDRPFPDRQTRPIDPKQRRQSAQGIVFSAPRQLKRRKSEEEIRGFKPNKLSKLSSGLSKLTSSFSSVTLAAGAVAAVFSVFSVLADLENQKKEEAIKKGDRDAALAANANEQSFKATQKSSAALGALGFALGGPIGALAGLGVALALGEGAVTFFVDAVSGAINALSELPLIGKYIGDFAESSGLTKALGDLDPAINRVKTSLDVIVDASKNFADEFKTSSQKIREDAENALKLATTPEDRRGKISSTARRLATKNVSARSRIEADRIAAKQQRDAGLARARQIGGRTGAALSQDIIKKYNESIKELKEQTLDMNAAMGTNIEKSFELARTYGESQTALEELNEGQRIQVDANNNIIRSSLAAGGALDSYVQSLIDVGLSQEEALGRLNQKIFGVEGAMGQLGNALDTAAKSLGSIIFDLAGFAGGAAQLKAADAFGSAQRIAGGGDVFRNREGLPIIRALLQSGQPEIGGVDIYEGLREQLFGEGSVFAGLREDLNPEQQNKLIDSVFGVNREQVDKLEQIRVLLAEANKMREEQNKIKGSVTTPQSVTPANPKNSRLGFGPRSAPNANSAQPETPPRKLRLAPGQRANVVRPTAPPNQVNNQENTPVTVELSKESRLAIDKLNATLSNIPSKITASVEPIQGTVEIDASRVTQELPNLINEESMLNIIEKSIQERALSEQAGEA